MYRLKWIPVLALIASLWFVFGHACAPPCGFGGSLPSPSKCVPLDGTQDTDGSPSDSKTSDDGPSDGKTSDDGAKDDKPPTDAPPTDAPPTDAPPTDAPPTDAPPSDQGGQTCPCFSSAQLDKIKNKEGAACMKDLPVPLQGAMEPVTYTGFVLVNAKDLEAFGVVHYTQSNKYFCIDCLNCRQPKLREIKEDEYKACVALNAGRCVSGCPDNNIKCDAKCTQFGATSNIAFCNNTCVDLANDPNNCGFCGRKCPSGVSCAVGFCGGEAPPPPDGGPPPGPDGLPDGPPPRPDAPPLPDGPPTPPKD